MLFGKGYNFEKCYVHLGFLRLLEAVGVAVEC